MRLEKNWQVEEQILVVKLENYGLGFEMPGHNEYTPCAAPSSVSRLLKWYMQNRRSASFRRMSGISAPENQNDQK